jgi:putative protease
MEELSKASHREFSTGFYFERPKKQIYGNSSYIRSHDIVGLVVGYDESTGTATIEQRNRVFKGEEVEILTPVGDNFSIVLNEMWNEEGEEIDVAPHPQMIYKVKTEKVLKPFDMLVKEKGD